ncbi:hypothetical protein [Raineyella fluvialis]|nr:hypothetical protein [Raineyella fluvialis]
MQEDLVVAFGESSSAWVMNVNARLITTPKKVSQPRSLRTCSTG